MAHAIVIPAEGPSFGVAPEGTCRCVMFYLIQRTDAVLFQPADHIDPEYGRELRKSLDNGVEILVYDVMIDMKSIRINRKLPYKL